MNNGWPGVLFAVSLNIPIILAFYYYSYDKFIFYKKEFGENPTNNQQMILNEYQNQIDIEMNDTIFGVVVFMLTLFNIFMINGGIVQWFTFENWDQYLFKLQKIVFRWIPPFACLTIGLCCLFTEFNIYMIFLILVVFIYMYYQFL